MAHNVGISRSLRKRKAHLVSLEVIAEMPGTDNDGHAAGHAPICDGGAAVLFWSYVWLLFSRHAMRLELELERLNGLRAE